MIQAFSLIYKFFNIASPCGDMVTQMQQQQTISNARTESMYATIIIQKENKYVVLSQ